MSERLHPYELAFGGAIEAEVFPRIREEAAQRDVDVREIERFLLLETVGELLRSLQPEGSPGSAVAQFRAIVTHAYHYWLADKPTFAIEESELRALLAPATTIGSWDMAPPRPAGYIQLPRNLLFARIDEAAHAEAVDGFFFLMPGTGDAAVPPFERLSVLLVLGLLPQRAGFSVIEVATTTVSLTAGHFGDVQARETGTDFENVLPGGTDRLFAVTNSLEVLKLAARCLAATTRAG